MALYKVTYQEQIVREISVYVPASDEREARRLGNARIHIGECDHSGDIEHSDYTFESLLEVDWDEFVTYHPLADKDD